MRHIFGDTRREEDGHWISISDLMAGLMVIFLFIAITYIRPIVETQSKIKDIVVAWNNSEIEIYEALWREFKDDLKRWNADLDKETLTVRFKSPDILFDQAEDSLKPRFENILNDFFPRYINVLYQFKDSIEEVRIEGHTSSEWADSSTQRQAYLKNMELSQARTRSVLGYVLDLPKIQSRRDWVVRHVTANGLSSSRLIRDERGREDKVRSRRVEFRVRTDAKQQIVRVLETVQ
jgi:outer membrane protein OmpA-like peptidoglycan-associated protein